MPFQMNSLMYATSKDTECAITKNLPIVHSCGRDWAELVLLHCYQQQIIHLKIYQVITITGLSFCIFCLEEKPLNRIFRLDYQRTRTALNISNTIIVVFQRKLRLLDKYTGWNFEKTLCCTNMGIVKWSAWFILMLKANWRDGFKIVIRHSKCDVNVDPDYSISFLNNAK